VTDAERATLFASIGVSAVYNPDRNDVQLEGSSPLLQQRVGGPPTLIVTGVSNLGPTQLDRMFA
jgi:hypothetical protein